jgi:RHS repeat-associated protein
VIPEKRAELLVDPFLYSSDNRYTYTGQEQDEFGGLIYYNARWYDAEVGRFISEDPAVAVPENPLTINRYVYCRNNPLIYIDPSGEFFAEILSVFGPIGTLIGAIVDAVIVNYAINFAVNAIAGEMERNGDKRGAQFLRNAYTAYVVISTVVNVINAFESVAKTADGVGSETYSDITPKAEQMQPATPSNGAIPDAETVRPNATVNGSSAKAGDITLVEVEATGTGGTYESTISAKGNTYSGSSLPNSVSTQATVATGEYKYVVEYSDYYKSNVLIVNEGGNVPVTGGFNPNVNYPATYGTPYADGILVHSGDSLWWRGSAGCITVQPNQWNAFINNFQAGDTGKIRVIR